MLTVFLINIPLDETVHICINKLFEYPENLVNGIPKNDFSDLLNLGTKEALFTFSNKFNFRVDGMAIGALLGPPLLLDTGGKLNVYMTFRR